MKYQQLLKEIKIKKFSSVYLFTGEEQYIADMMIQNIIRAAIPEGMEQLNVMTFSDKDTDISEIVGICRQLPMMSSYRVVVVRESVGLLRSSAKEGLSLFLNYIEKPENKTILIIQEKKPDKRKKIYKQIMKNSVLVNFEKLTFVEIENWIAMRLKRAGKTIGTHALRQAIERSRYIHSDHVNVEMMDNWTAQLIDYAKEKSSVSSGDVEAVIPKAIDDNIFEMINAAVAGNTGQALKMLDLFYHQGESPFGVFGLLSSQIRTMTEVEMLSEKRISPSQIASQVKRPLFIVKKMSARSRQIGLNQLIKLMMTLADLDLSMKTGKIDPELATSLLIIKLSNKKR
ncbi:DNA polymerase III subunit delta [Pseudoramibacter sp.]|jgi:DNA polymerase-3 subunit delta|uniref:DNA polymerase III subunit delta n=1 Tax=Pseudoramibacter sp. TaxID=2034862 RepID=UPI0025FF065B|nr:DNA polymerase III subunit delta [Pseudoramibacter sp.]MCH4072988.1 DNA polymerase III subunit delta [Pseudoramibacter sp.]MCH4106759.1 DNA polymerase III subunit delta [Pseudoramibacter sp.]